MPTPKSFRKSGAGTGATPPTSGPLSPTPCHHCSAPSDWRKQIAGLRELKDDLGAQVDELRAAQPMTPDERKDVDRRMTEHRMMYATEAAIRQWLIDRKKDNIDKGAHDGKSLDQLVIAYLEGRL